ncbi:hypothetical protein [Azotosporobacter soli]|uniref:hypothetical protein n=1 Tax=Azotosporobacter soli TaxID=3055040 RepID=UPI0031FECE9F
MRENNILETITAFQEALFSGELTELGEHFAKIADALGSWSACLTEERQMQLVALLESVLKAFANQDYLLVADLLEYQLLPFVKEGGK